jgi:hypothetical protein
MKYYLLIHEFLINFTKMVLISLKNNTLGVGMCVRWLKGKKCILSPFEALHHQ